MKFLPVFTMTTSFIQRVLFGLSLMSLIATAASAAGMTTLEIGAERVELEIASTAIEQRTGLMNREHLADNHGMLFVFSEPRSVAMWMKNTLIDLDAAFVDPCGRILNIESMKKATLNLHRSRGHALFVIEMNAGWFARHNVSTGQGIKDLLNPNFCKKP